MSGCGCGQSTGAASSLGEPAGDALALALANEVRASVPSLPGMGEAEFLSASELEATLSAELAAVETEDEARATQELYAAVADTSTEEPSLADILAIVRANPGLKVTFSF